MGIFGPHHDAGEDGSDKARITLGAGVVAAFAGPAFACRADGSVTIANDKAQTILCALAEDAIVDGRALIARAAEERRPIVEVVMIPGANGPQMLEWTLLPTDDGGVLVLVRDVTLECNLRAALFESRQRYKDLVEISSDFAWEVGADGRFVFVSPRGALGYPADALVGRRPQSFVIDHSDLDSPLPFLTNIPVEDGEVWMRSGDGATACLLAAAAPLLGADGTWRGARGLCRDITHERARDAALARASNRERLLTYIVRTIRDVVDPGDMLAAAAEATARALGACGCQVFRLAEDGGEFVLATEFGHTRPADDILAGFADADHFEGELGPTRVLATVTRYRRDSNGAICLWREADRANWSDDDRLLIDDVATQIGIANEQIANHERILTLSRTDALTGLFNRRAFFEELARRFARLSREGRPAALIYVDLDNFKLVNDAHGHQRGDEALLQVRDILSRSTRPIDLLARLGGDEFAIWLEGADQATAVKRCEGLLEAAHILRPYSGSPDCPLHMSLGLAVYDPQRGETLEELVVRADKAMYKVKREGKGNWFLAPPSDGAGEGAT